MASAWQAIAEETEDYENDARYYLSKAFRMMNAQRGLGKAKFNKQEQIYAKRVKTMIQCIEEQYADAKIYEVAMNCGFVDFSYFAKCFREIKGVRPKNII